MIKKTIMFILILTSAITLVFGIYSDILPSLYLKIFVFGYLLIDVILLFLIKRKNKLLYGIGLFLSFIMIIFSIACSFVCIRIQILFDNISEVSPEMDAYVVLVLKESNYEVVSDLNDKSLGILEEGDTNYNEALKSLQINCGAKYENYDNVLNLAKALLAKDVEAIFLNQAYIAILDEGIEGFSDQTRILDTIKIAKEQEERKNNTVNIDNKEAFNVYISGIDTYGEINTVSRSDVNIIATINLRSGEVLLTNIPRDMYVQLAGMSGLRDKLTHAGVYGIDTSIKTIENFLDTDIDYYVRINFSSLIQLVDYLGGIDIYSDYDFEVAGYHFNKGMNYNLTGRAALYFSRDRYSFSDGDRQRGRNQERVIAAIINKVTKSNDTSTYFKLISTLENSFQTNMDRNTMNKLINRQLENNYQWEISFSDINGYDSMNYTYSYPWQKLYVMEVDDDSLQEAKNKITNILQK